MSTTDHASSAPLGWTTIIRPTRGLFDLRLGQLWKCRDLISLFVWRDFVSAYKQTILGPAWHIIQPLFTTLTFGVIFGQVARLPTDGAPSFVFYMTGVVLWSYFSACLTKTASTFVSHAHVYGKVYFHRLAIPVSIVISNFVTFAIQLVVLFGFVAAFALSGANVHASPWLVLSPLLFLMLAGYGFAGGIIVAALTTRYRDLANLVAFGMQLFMYATPIIYPMSLVPPRYRLLILLNPLSSIVETFRAWLLGAGTVSPIHLLYSAGVLAALMLAGLLSFNRVEQTFIDTV